MAGMVHILAISGLHISILGMGLFSLLKKNGPGECRSRPSFSVCDASIWNAYRRKRVCHEGGVYVCPECRSKGFWDGPMIF